MGLITRDELKRKLDTNENFKLVMALAPHAFTLMRIPGSMLLSGSEHAFEDITTDDEIVLYCAGADSPASQIAYDLLTERGYKYVYRYAGGLADWAAAGYPLEGEAV